MKNFTLRASAAAIAVAFSGLASAAVDLDTGTGANTYASELITNGTTAIDDDNLDVTHTLGFGVSNTQTRYIRYDLTNATLNTAANANDLTVATATVALVQGGGAGDNYAIFQITAGADYAANQAATFDLGSGASADGIKVTDKALPSRLTYSLYESAADAVTGGSSGRLSNKSATIAGFSSGLAFTVATNTTTADVTTLYKNFKAGSGGFVAATTANIGDVTFNVNSNVKPDGTATAIGDLVAAGTKLILKGSDLAAAAVVNGVYISTDAACGGVGVGPTGLTSTQVEFAIGASAQAGLGLCFEANGSTPIAAQDFTLEADVVPAPGTDTADRAAIAAGDFDRDGTVLKAPYMGGAAGQFTSVQMANMGNNDAPYTVRCFAPSGTDQPGIGGTVPSGNTMDIYMNNLGCQAGADAVEFTFAVPTGTVNGTLVRRNTTSGDSAFYSLTGNE